MSFGLKHTNPDPAVRIRDSSVQELKLDYKNNSILSEDEGMGDNKMLPPNFSHLFESKKRITDISDGS